MKFFVWIGFFYSVFLEGSAQVSRFGKTAGVQDQNTVYEYRKSNWDGTHASSVFLYVMDKERLESFKWWDGDTVATLVSAVINWKTYSVTEFQNHKLTRGRAPQLMAKLKGDRVLKIEVGEMKDSLVIDELPWQSYDFDFAGLSYIWRALKNKSDSFWFHIADVAMINGAPRFVNKGRVIVRFVGVENINGKNCLKYSADGVGLENKGGHIWINPQGFMIEQYKIALPDEPDFENGLMKLEKTFKMNAAEWETFKRQKLDQRPNVQFN